MFHSIFKISNLLTIEAQRYVVKEKIDVRNNQIGEKE